MSESATERKARLKALRAEAEESAAVPRRDAAEEPPVVKFRNYLPKDEELRTAKVAPAAAPEALPAAAAVEAGQAPLQPEVDNGEDIVAQVQPKKANWDLQRDVAKALDKLERRTQRALIELARQEDQRRMKESLGAADAGNS